MLARRNNRLNSILGDSFFRNFFSGFEPAFSDDSRRYVIPVDIVSNDDNVTVTASLPGVSVDDVEVLVENGVLTINNKSDISNEKSDGNYVLRERVQGLSTRSIRLPENADVDSAEVSLKEGILSVQFKNGHPRQVKALPISTS